LDGSHAAWLIEDYDKGYLFLLHPQSKYVIISKTTINGDLLWQKHIGNGLNFISAGNIEHTIDNGMIMNSTIDKYDPNKGDPALIKFNSCAEIEWCKIISTPGIYDFSVRVRQTQQGDYVLLTDYSDVNPVNRIQLFKFNSTGSLVWKHNYPGDSIYSNDDGYDVMVLNDGYLITGSCYSPDSGQTGVWYERPYYIRTDTSGNELWRLAYGRVNGFHGFPGYYTLKSTTGNFYDVGWHSNYCDTPALFKCMNDGSEGYYKDVVPDACPGGDGSLNWLDDSTFVLFAGGTVSGSTLVKWLKLDTLGNELYSKVFPDGWITRTSYSIVTFDKKIVALSDHNPELYFYKLNQNFDFDSIYTHPYVYDSLCPHPIISDTIDPNCDLIVSIDDSRTNPQASKLKVYPNPATNRISIEFPKVLVVRSGQGKYQSSKEYYQWKSTLFEVYNIEGKKVFEKEIPKLQQQLELDISDWQRGLYYFRLVYDKQTVDGQKVLISSQ